MSLRKRFTLCRTFFCISFFILPAIPTFFIFWPIHRWNNLVDPNRYITQDLPVNGITLTGALIAFKPDENKMLVQWRVGGSGSDYTISESDALAKCSLYDAMPAFNGSDVTSLNQTIWFDGQPVFTSSSVADHRTGEILPCGQFTTGGREFLFEHSLDVGLDYRAQRVKWTSYPYDSRTTSSRVCAREEIKRVKEPFSFMAVMVTRVDGFLVRSNFSKITTATDAPGYVIQMTLQRDRGTRFNADALWIVGWIVTALGIVLTILGPLYAYPRD
ncbi:hypothetical protein FRB90_002634, partial [Tulasnella sp. 427]